MNKRKLFHGSLRLPDGQSGAFLVCGAMFAAGVVIGSLQSSDFCEGGAAARFMGPYIQSVTGSGGAVELFRFFLGVGIYPAAVFLMGFSILGVAGIPLLSLARGFAAGFSLSVFVRLYSGRGVVMGLLLVGLQTAISVPVFLPVAAQALTASLELARLGLFSGPGKSGIYARAYFIRFFAAMILLLLLSAGGVSLIEWGLTKLPAFS